MPSLDYSLAEFKNYLVRCKIQYFSAAELTLPHDLAKAKSCGYGIFLPEISWWPRAAVLCHFADKARELVDEPIRARNWWRPAAYNKIVGGAKSSDHLEALALDLDFASEASCKKATEYFLKLQNDEVHFGISLGLGAKTIHFGLLTDLGKRTWKYGSYTE